jgi:hypothetical protein
MATFAEAEAFLKELAGVYFPSGFNASLPVGPNQKRLEAARHEALRLHGVSG